MSRSEAGALSLLRVVAYPLPPTSLLVDRLESAAPLMRCRSLTRSFEVVWWRKRLSDA